MLNLSMSALHYLLLALLGVGVCLIGADAMITGPRALNLVIFATLFLNAIYLFVIEPPGSSGIKRTSIFGWKPRP
jgi:hypothetical protein